MEESQSKMVHGPLAPVGGGKPHVGSTPPPPRCAQVAPTYLGTGGTPRIPLYGIACLMHPVRTACGMYRV
jgi:hypothetical protein